MNSPVSANSIADADTNISQLILSVDELGEMVQKLGETVGLVHTAQTKLGDDFSAFRRDVEGRLADLDATMHNQSLQLLDMMEIQEASRSENRANLMLARSSGGVSNFVENRTHKLDSFVNRSKEKVNRSSIAE